MKVIFICVFIIQSLSLKSQEELKINDFNIKIIGVIEMQDLVLVNPQKYDFRKINRNPQIIATEKRNLKIVENTKIKNFKYLALEPNFYLCLSRFSNANFPFDYLLPIAKDSIKELLEDAYRNPYFSKFCKNYYGFRNYSEFKIGSYEYTEITHSKWLVVLINVELYNDYLKKTLPFKGVFLDEKTIKGMYVKLLIPV